MKKQFTLVAAALIAFAMTGCDKKGTIEGVVLNPFTGKPVSDPIVWMEQNNQNTIFGTQAAKYAYKAELAQGKFKFEKVPAGEYVIKSRISKYNPSEVKFTTSNEDPNKQLTLYIYSDKINPGLYQGSEEGEKKISNEWVIWSTPCNESLAGYRLNIPKAPEKANAKAAKKGKKGKKGAESAFDALPAPRVMDAEFSVFYRNVGTAPIQANTYPAVEGKVADHADCKNFEANEKTGIFADKSKGTALNVEYVADGLSKITGTLPKGKQIIQLVQDGKTMQTYYFEVK